MEEGGWTKISGMMVEPVEEKKSGWLETISNQPRKEKKRRNDARPLIPLLIALAFFILVRHFLGVFFCVDYSLGFISWVVLRNKWKTGHSMALALGQIFLLGTGWMGFGPGKLLFFCQKLKK